MWTKTERDDEGFTLIELMVVVLIIAILVAIAIPTFLGAKQRAQDKAAQANLRNALTAAKTVLVDTGDYNSLNTTSLKAAEPSLTYIAGSATQAKDIGIANATAYFAAAAKSDSGTCWLILDYASTAGAATNGVYYGSTSGSCVAVTVTSTPTMQSKW